jgi:cold shock CspA family protein
MRGHIKILWAAFGFVTAEDSNQDYYFHTSSIEVGPNTKLAVHDLVEFDVEQHRGVSEAVRVRLPDKPARGS